MKRWLILAATLMLAIAAGADRAGACTCADQDERDRFEAGEVGVLGRVLESEPPAVRDPPRPGSYRYRVRVERSVGARLAREVTIAAPEDGCGPAPLVAGQGLAGLPRRRAGRWVIEGCSFADPTEFRRALRPYPRALGRGRLALLAGGDFGDARLMALDAGGRILGYGFGQGEVSEVSVCPGGLTAAEAVRDGSRWTVAVRDLRSLKVLTTSTFATRADQVEPGAATVHCEDPDGRTVHAAFHNYVQRRERVHIFRAGAEPARRIARLRAYGVTLTGGVAYVNGPEGLFAVDLVDGGRRRLSRARFPEGLEVSPDRRRIAFYADGRLRIYDLATGRQRARKTRYGDQILWLSSRRFLFREGGRARVYDLELRVRRRLAFVRFGGQAKVGNQLFGMDRHRLRARNLVTGSRRTVARLPDRGIVALRGVDDRPLIEAGRRAPSLPYTVLRPARCRCAVGAAIGGVVRR